MRIPAGIARHAQWAMLVLAAVCLALVVVRLAARSRAVAASMSAELLSPLDTAALEPTGEREPEPLATAGAASPARDSLAPSDSAAASPAAPADSAPADPPVRKLPPLDPELFPDWTSFAAAVPLARRTDRPVLLAFSAYGCELCLQLARDVFRDEAAGVTLRSAVVPVAVDDPLAGGSDGAREADELQRRFDVTSFPTLVLYFPASGRARKLEGYPGRDRTLRWVTETSTARR
jgi:hypothetical protein